MEIAKEDLEPGNIYVGKGKGAHLIFLYEGSLTKCACISVHTGVFRKKVACCTASYISITLASKEDAAWLRACIKEKKWVNRYKVIVPEINNYYEIY